MKLILKNGRIIDPVTGKDQHCDIMIVEGAIERIGVVTSSKNDTVIELNGKIVAPGFIDMHVHFREPGFEHKETIESGVASAIAGGFTAVCCMPNTNPPIDDESVVRYIRERGKQVYGGIVDVFPVAAATKGRGGEELSPMAELTAAGAVAFTDDGAPIASAEIMRRAFEYSSMFGLPIIQHAEEPTLSRGGSVNEGFHATKAGLAGIPPIAETVMVSRDLILLEYAPKAKYHVAHISTRGAVDLIRGAKKKGLNATCEVTPHHFTLSDEAILHYDTNTKMNPPLRTRDDVVAMKEALRDGIIDVIATDHAPHTIDEKEVEYSEAPFGIIGLETALGLALTELVREKYLSLADLIRKFSTSPREILSLPQIRIEEGARANLTIFDPQLEWEVDSKKFRSKSRNTPFNALRLRGKAFALFSNNIFRLCE
jgi:dihydroorotase